MINFSYAAFCYNGTKVLLLRLCGLLFLGVTRVAGLDGAGGGAGLRVFLSHTSELRNFPEKGSYVAGAERAISDAGHVVVEMADFPAADQPAAQLCAERVQGCQVYVGVLGTRYGSAVRERPEVGQLVTGMQMGQEGPEKA